ncbi:Ankyrin repeat domain-containing 52 protein [Rutstroemia sp. NJR-2017a WRK4]|nr:Ankyrin repeat domain-containing 52 protein [Rutstroemia sp. NJR-2017a WRK4]
MNSKTLVVGRLPLSSNQIYADERADLMKRDLPERPRNLRENISNNRPLSTINNAWRGSFAGGRAVKPKFLESRTFPANVPTAHRQPEGSETREDHPCSVPEDCQSSSQNPLQPVAVSSIVQSSLPEIHPGPSQNSLEVVTTSPKDPIVQSSLPENRLNASLQAVTASSIVQSSLPENRLSTSQNPVHPVTTCSIVQHPQILSPDYADPRRVPGTDQNIYPRAPINPEFHERYPQLVDFFKQAVDTHKFLKYHTSKINYELRLCGSTPSNAVASIIIFCAEALFKDLRSLLNSKHILRQYQPINPSLREKFLFTPSKPHLQASAPIVAPFKIVFWREATTPTQRRAAIEQVVAKSHSFLTMCGSLVRYGDRTSTLGLLISVDSKLYGLTVDHLFKSQRGEEQATIANEPDILPDEDDPKDDQADWLWIDDVKYEDMENDGRVLDKGLVISGQSDAKVTMDYGLTEYYGASINGHKVDWLSVTDAATPYLDWALIEFDDGYYERPNAFYSEDDPANPKFLRRLSAAPKTSEVNVFMISGVSGTRKGVMLNSNSYIGGKPSENLCQAWNVILSDSGRVIDGDCGSLIVDQETLEVYGHVVASNPLGEAYVVPLQNTLHQISNALGAKDLSLPNPGLLMESLVTYYSKAGDSGVADEATRILASMEGLSSTTSLRSASQLHVSECSYIAELEKDKVLLAAENQTLKTQLYYERDQRGRDGVPIRSSSTRCRSPSEPHLSERFYTAELEDGTVLLAAENRTLKTELYSQPRLSERFYTAELENGNVLLAAENRTLKMQLGIHEARTRIQSSDIGRLEDRIRQLELAATVRERDYCVLEDKFEATDARRQAAEKAHLFKGWTPTSISIQGSLEDSTTKESLEDSTTKESLEARIEDLRVMVQERDERIRHLDVKLADLNLKVKTRDKSIVYLKDFLGNMGYQVDVNI